MNRDENRIPYSSLDSFDVVKVTPAAFTGGTDSSHGDKDNTPTLTLFTVTGDVEVGIFGVCTTALTGASGTAQVGVAGNTAGLIALTTATDIDGNEIWLDTTPSVGVDVTDALSFHFVVNSLNIIETVATTDIATGAIYYVCLWRPLTPGSTVVADGTTLSA